MASISGTDDVKIILDAVDNASGKISGVASAMGLINIAATAVVATIGLVTTAFAVAIKASIAYGTSLEKTMQMLGLTSKQAAGLNLIAKTAGVSVEQLSTSLSMMSRNLITVDGKLGSSGKAIKSLGINLTDTKGIMKDANTLFGEIATAINKMPDGMQKTALEMQIFGRSGKEMADVLELAANGGMQKFMDTADKMGLSLTDLQVKRIKELDQSLNLLKETVLGIEVVVGSAFVPAIQGAIKWAGNLIQGIMPAVEQFGQFLTLLMGGTVYSPTAAATQSYQKPAKPGGVYGGGDTEFDAGMKSFWNGKGPDPRKAGYGAGGATPGGARGRTLRDEEIPQLPEGTYKGMTDFEKAIKGFIDALKTVDWETFAKRLVDFATQLAKVDWDPIFTTIEKAILFFTYIPDILNTMKEKWAAAMGGWQEFFKFFSINTGTMGSRGGMGLGGRGVGGRASGGDIHGWGMVGDAPGGGITPYTEYVYAPQGARVFTQSQMGGSSAPSFAGGGIISPAKMSKQFIFNDDAKLEIKVNNGQTIDEVINEVLDKLK